MKILYITNHASIQKAGGYVNDYLNDLMFFGLHELCGQGAIAELVDSTPIMHMYADNEASFDKNLLWGLGFSSSFLIDGDGSGVDRSALDRKIQDKYFDYIVYGSCKRCLDYYEIVSTCYDNKEVIMIDGDDDTALDTELLGHPYFKRELLPQHMSGNVMPISFGMPLCKFSFPNRNKTKDFASILPWSPDTYVYNNEADYYKGYNDSCYGMTTKRAGWDCMRHYEILASYAMPYFPGLSECPPSMLCTYPKALAGQGMELALDFSLSAYHDLMAELYVYAKMHLTTKALASYLLSSIV